MNNELQETNLPSATLLLDYIRYHRHLTATKIGCREGDCGACTVMLGNLENDTINYKTVTSCLTPIANVHGKHVVTVEGINQEKELTPVQNAMLHQNATQCGFCTPGFVMSLTNFCISEKETSSMAAMDGNICRCTGYQSLKKAGLELENLKKTHENDLLEFCVAKKIVPLYFNSMASKLKTINQSFPLKNNDVFTIAGGTDMYVQKHDALVNTSPTFTQNILPKTIEEDDNTIIISGATTVTDLMESNIVQEYFPNFNEYCKLVSSTPIRNIATIAGNICNASPIGDFSIMLLVLDAKLNLKNIQTDATRTVALRDFYKGYKQIDKQENEIVTAIQFNKIIKPANFHFEKVCKRTYLDIASVNTAMCASMENNIFTNIHLSAGGVAPIPFYLQKTAAFLVSKENTKEIIDNAIELMQTEIAPISDARGTAEYKRFLLAQLVREHFNQLGK